MSTLIKPDWPSVVDPNEAIAFRYNDGRPVYPMVGGAKGYNAHGDIITKTNDGVDINALWSAYQDALAEWNAQRSALVRLFTFNLSASFETVFPMATGTAEFEEATEYGEPVGHRPETGSDTIGFRFKWYDLAARFTWQFLADAPSNQVDSIANMALEADNRLVFGEVMRTLFRNARGTNKETNVVYPFYSGEVGDKPDPEGAKTFADQHNHFTTTGTGGLTQPDVEGLIDNVTEHGYSKSRGYSVIVMANKAQGDVIRGFRSTANGGNGLYDFIPAQGTPSFLLPLNMQTADGSTRPPSSYQGFDVIGSYGDALIIQESYIPVGYLVCIATGGEDNLSNPIGVREHPNASLRGLRLVKGREPDYPLIDSFYLRGFGTGVRHRGAGAVLQVTDAATYTAPTQYVS